MIKYEAHDCREERERDNNLGRDTPALGLEEEEDDVFIIDYELGPSIPPIRPNFII